MIVTDERVARFVSEKTAKAFCPPYTVVGWEEEGKITCGFLFNVFEGSDCHVSVAGNKFPRALMKAIGDYAFNQLKLNRCTVITEQEHVLDLCNRVGGVREGILRGHFGEGKDAVIVGVLKSEYRFPVKAGVSS